MIGHRSRAPDRFLDELVDHATAAAEADCETTELPSFGAVVTRARVLDSSLPEMTGIRVSPPPALPDGDGLDLFIDSARAQAESECRERERAGIPARRSPSRWRFTSVSLGAAAAVVAGWLGLMALQDEPGRAMVGDTGMTPQAAASAERAGTETVEHRGSPAPVTMPTHPVEEASDPAEEGTAPADLRRPSVTPPETRRRTPGEDLDGRLRRMDEEAEAALRAGDAILADRLYTEIIRLGGWRPVVELAYADRFTLAHDSGDPARQRRLWTQYLRRFPRGRLADDARAGLCRQAPTTAARSCWGAYLVDFPHGAYRSQAQRTLDREVD